MALITKLVGGVRDPNRVNVFLDGKFAFSLDVAQVVELGVKVGQQVDAVREAELLAASEFGKLYQKTLEWALSRPHSVRETKDYLKRQSLKRAQNNRQREREGKKPWPEIKERTAELVLARLTERGYVDDEKFARYMTENYSARKGVSRKKLIQQLRAKGVADYVVERALAESPRDEKDELTRLAQKKRARYDDLKLTQYLVRQGFDYQSVKEVIQNLAHETD